MELRTGRAKSSYIYATSPIRLIAVRNEDIVLVILLMAIGFTLQWPRLFTTSLCALGLWMNRVISPAGDEAAFVHSLHTTLGRLASSKRWGSNKAVKWLTRQMLISLDETSCLPPHSYISRYDP